MAFDLPYLAIPVAVPVTTPCGSGTCARLAVLAADGRLPPGTVLRHDSIVGRTVLDSVDVDGCPAVIPQVTDMAYGGGKVPLCG